MDEETLDDGVVTTVENLRAYVTTMPFDHLMLVLARMAAKARAF